MDNGIDFSGGLAELVNTQPDKNIFEFDYSLWSLLKNLSSTHTRDIANQFSLPRETVELLSQASESQLKLLSSGVIISFRLSGDENNYIESLEHGRYDENYLANPSEQAALTEAYWLLLARLATAQPIVATQTFGVSKNLVAAAAKASDNQLRSLAASQLMTLEIRFSADLLHEILRSDSGSQNITVLILKKHQQCLFDNRGTYVE